MVLVALTTLAVSVVLAALTVLVVPAADEGHRGTWAVLSPSAARTPSNFSIHGGRRREGAPTSCPTDPSRKTVVDLSRRQVSPSTVGGSDGWTRDPYSSGPPLLRIHPGVETSTVRGAVTRGLKAPLDRHEDIHSPSESPCPQV